MRILWVAALAALSACASMPAHQAAAAHWSIVIHGGAGVIERGSMTPEIEAQYREAMARLARTGGAILDRGGSSLDAVQAIISEMEDDPLFNAGRGAVFGADGRNHLDASIMDGRTRAAGAVADIQHTRHPIQLARAAMEHSPHVMLVGESGEAFGESEGLEHAPPSFFFTERRWQQLEEELRRQNLPIPARPEGAPPAPQSWNANGVDDHRFGTVGVVAMDAHGDIAAGTSTGGMTAKRWGRVGDSPIIGAGTYAQNGVCGVSGTGWGEFFIRIGVAREICARMELLHESAEQAAEHVIGEVGATTNAAGQAGDGGVIVMDGRGHAAWRFNTSGMYRARLEAGGEPEVKIYRDE